MSGFQLRHCFFEFRHLFWGTVSCWLRHLGCFDLRRSGKGQDVFSKAVCNSQVRYTIPEIGIHGTLFCKLSCLSLVCHCFVTRFALPSVLVGLLTVVCTQGCMLFSKHWREILAPVSGIWYSVQLLTAALGALTLPKSGLYLNLPETLVASFWVPRLRGRSQGMLVLFSGPGHFLRASLARRFQHHHGLFHSEKAPQLFPVCCPGLQTLAFHRHCALALSRMCHFRYSVWLYISSKSCAPS